MGVKTVITIIKHPALKIFLNLFNLHRTACHLLQLSEDGLLGYLVVQIQPTRPSSGSWVQTFGSRRVVFALIATSLLPYFWTCWSPAGQMTWLDRVGLQWGWCEGLGQCDTASGVQGQAGTQADPVSGVELISDQIWHRGLDHTRCQASEWGWASTPDCTHGPTPCAISSLWTGPVLLIWPAAPEG